LWKAQEELPRKLFRRVELHEPVRGMVMTRPPFDVTVELKLNCEMFELPRRIPLKVPAEVFHKIDIRAALARYEEEDYIVW
jgi:hypothetical protein